MPEWKQTVNIADVWKNDAMSFEERRDVIVRRLRASSWTKNNDTLFYLVDELADAETPDEFDDPWSQIYDEADADRVWIKTF